MHNPHHQHQMTTNNRLAALMAKNNAGEQEAIKDYFELLTTPGLPHELYADIQEIISDEMNHSEKLSKWATILSGVQPNET